MAAKRTAARSTGRSIAAPPTSKVGVRGASRDARALARRRHTAGPSPPASGPRRSSARCRSCGRPMSSAVPGPARRDRLLMGLITVDGVAAPGSRRCGRRGATPRLLRAAQRRDGRPRPCRMGARRPIGLQRPGCGRPVGDHRPTAARRHRRQPARHRVAAARLPQRLLVVSFPWVWMSTRTTCSAGCSRRPSSRPAATGRPG